MGGRPERVRERVTWKGNIPQQGELIRRHTHRYHECGEDFNQHHNVLHAACKVELPPNHLEPSPSFIRGLLSLLIYRLIDLILFLLLLSHLLCFLAQLFIEFMSFMSSTTM